MRCSVTTGVVFMTAAALFWGAATTASAGEAAVLSDADHNGRWSVGPDGVSAQIKGNVMAKPTLSFRVDELRRAPLALVVKSDTRSVTVRVDGASRRFETTGGDQTLVMDAGREPVLAFNGRAKAAWQGAWREGLAEGREVTLEFAPCLFVKLSWHHDGRVTVPEVEGEVEADDGEEEGNDRRRDRRHRRRGPIEADPPDVRRIEGSIVQLRVRRGERAAVGLTPAVVVSRGGLAVASLHALAGATEVKAEVFDRAVENRLPVEPVGIDADHDLALVRLDVTADGAARAALMPLTPADALPEKDAAVWVAHRVGGRTRLSGGHVTWSGLLGELGSRSRDKLGYPEASRWMLIDAESDRGYAMRPIVDKEGELVGLGAWTWPMSGEVVAGLSVEHVSRLMDGTDTTRSMSWLAVSEETEGRGWPYATFPRVAMEGGEGVSKLGRAIQIADRSHACPRCEARGFVLRRVTLGYERGGGVRKPVNADKAFECPRCDGSGLQEERPMVAGWGVLAGAIAAADLEEEGTSAQFERAAGTLATMGKNHFRGLVDISERRAAELIEAGPEAIGESVVLFGERVRVGRRSELGGESGLQAIRVFDPTEEEDRRRYRRGRDQREAPTHAVVIDGVRHEAEGRGDLAAVAGVVAGFVAREKGEPALIVVNEAMIVPIEERELVERETAAEWNEANLPEVDER